MAQGKQSGAKIYFVYFESPIVHICGKRSAGTARDYGENETVQVEVYFVYPKPRTVHSFGKRSAVRV